MDASVAMLGRSAEQEALARAERDIADGERRVTDQIVLIEALRRDGHDVSEAEKLLQTFLETLVAWHGHRDEILVELARQGALPSTHVQQSPMMKE